MTRFQQLQLIAAVTNPIPSTSPLLNFDASTLGVSPEYFVLYTQFTGRVVAVQLEVGFNAPNSALSVAMQPDISTEVDVLTSTGKTVSSVFLIDSNKPLWVANRNVSVTLSGTLIKVRVFDPGQYI